MATWGLVLGAAAVGALGLVGGAKLVDSRVEKLQSQLTQVSGQVVEQADRLAEAIPGERYARMLEIVITDCEAVAPNKQVKCREDTEKVRGQLDKMRQMVGASGKAALIAGDWRISVWLTLPDLATFEAPAIMIVPMTLPNMAVQQSVEYAADQLTAELGSFTHSIETNANKLEVRRPLTDAEADRVVMDAAEAISFWARGTPEEFSRVQEFTARCGHYSVTPPEKLRICADGFAKEVTQAALKSAVTAYHAPRPTADGAHPGTAAGSAYRVERPYDPFGKKRHTAIVLSRKEVLALPEAQRKSMRIAVAVHEAGNVDSLFPGTSRMEYTGADLLDLPDALFRQGQRGVFFLAHGFTPRDGSGVDWEDLKKTADEARSLRKQLIDDYGKVSGKEAKSVSLP